MSRPLIAHVVGARPNYMKVAPIYAELERRGRVEQRLIHTGQHFDALMKDVFFAELPLPRPHFQLDARTPEDAFGELERVFAELEPDLVIVAGDVNSTLAGAVAGAKRGVRICHVESGLRSGDWSMPEERNRVITDHLSSLLLTHSEEADRNLAREAVDVDRISFVGNTNRHAPRERGRGARARAWREYGLEPGGYVLVTLHRPSLVDVPELLAPTIAALDDVAETLPVIFPVHPRTRRNLDSATTRSLDRAPAVPPVPLAGDEGGGRGDGLRRHSGGDDGPRHPLLHAARQHRAPGHDRDRHQHAARASAGAASGPPGAPRRAEARGDPAAVGRTSSARRAAEAVERLLEAW